MKRMLLALAAVAGLAAASGSARADWGGIGPGTGAAQLPPPGSVNGPGTLMGMGAASNPSRGPDVYGVAPWLRKPLRLRGATACPPVGPAVGGYGPVQQGTLAFPHHPFVRSPRDFFMWGN
jgi:hypothetical protein